MNDSQSPQILTQISVEDEYYNDFTMRQMDKSSYQDLLHKVKESMQTDFGVKSNNVIATELPQILKDCGVCVSQSFNFIITLLENSTTEELYRYIENTISIIHVLSNFLNNLINSIPLLKTLPTATGDIILAVFTHCKDSECIYGFHLHFVENQLKVLFRTCHELQLMYLMILEKHYVFNMQTKQEMEQLDECLLINLKICDIVQGLDIKTMAEQWKAFTVICEKYALYLKSTNIFDKCIDVIAASVKANVSLETVEDEKFMTRSLKVAGFGLKILLKLSNLFKDASYDRYKIVQLFYFILPYKNELSFGVSSKFPTLVENNVLSAVDILIKQLVTEEQFVNFVLNLPLSKFQTCEMLGYILLLSSISQHLAHGANDSNALKELLMTCVFNALPRCHVLFNMQSKIKLSANKYCEVYEYLLIQVTNLTSTFDSQQYTRLEGKFLAAICSADYCSALFASDLWLVLCRNNNQLQLITLTNIIRMYQKLEVSCAHDASPQQHHLIHTIQKMFGVMSYDDKVLIYRQFNLQDERNNAVWCAMAPALPENIRPMAENILTEKCLRYLKQFLVLKDMKTDDMNLAIQYTKLMACISSERDGLEMEEVLVSCWLKCCPSSGSIQNELNCLWYIQYVDALTVWTNSFKSRLQRNTSIGKILHVMSKILKTKNTELVLVLFETFCKLISQSEDEERHTDIVEAIFKEIDDYMKEYLFSIAIADKCINDFILQFLNKTSIDFAKQYIDFKNSLSSAKWVIQLEQVSDNVYVHKCNTSEVMQNELKLSQNIKQKDTECLIEQPICKKAKVNASVIEDIIMDIEGSTSKLRQYKDVLSEEQKGRLGTVCDKLMTMS